MGHAGLAYVLERALKKQNIETVTDAAVEAAVKKDASVVLSVRKGDSVSNVEADKVLVAVGRKPYVDGLHLDALGIAVHPKSGRIPVNDRFMTKNEGVYAIGDCIEGPMLAHKGFEEGSGSG
jgi:dihydrolipoamide dehydrogenase